MNFDQANKDDLLFNLEQLLTHMAEPVFVLGDDYKVVYANRAFGNFSQKDDDHIIGYDYGQAMGCSYISKDDKDCGLTYACGICRIRKGLDTVFENQEMVSDAFVRDFEIDGIRLFRHIHFNAVPLQIDGKIYAALIMTEVNQAPSE